MQASFTKLVLAVALAVSAVESAEHFDYIIGEPGDSNYNDVIYYQQNGIMTAIEVRDNHAIRGK